MEGFSLIDKLLQCCQKPDVSLETSAQTYSQKMSVRSQSRKNKASTYHKISLKTISINRSSKQLNNTNEEKQPLSPPRRSEGLQPFKKGNHSQSFQTKSLRIIKSPQSNTFQENFSKTPQNQTKIQKHSTAAKKKIFIFNQTQKYSKNRVRNVNFVHEAEAIPKKKIQMEGKEGQKRLGESLRNVKIIENTKCSIRQSRKGNQLGQSRDTVLSVQQVEEFKEIKMEQSTIVVDYFNPQKSELERWGLLKQK